mmetsp:Transcript_7830/g.34867  ORF Transcript_7830/g.34867 Transcript_7830/m.34867 type:complete len:97 (-) Transcript_7830:1119-1409(-)
MVRPCPVKRHLRRSLNPLFASGGLNSPGSSMRPTSLGTGGQVTPFIPSAETGLGSHDHGQQDITGQHQPILPSEELPDPIDLQEAPGQFEKLDVKS